MAEGRKKSRDGTRSVVVVEGLRTPFTRAGGPLARVHASELGRIPMEETLLRRGVPAAEVDEVIFGNVAQPADSANIARVIALRAGIPISAPASTVHRNCASGMEAITTAFDRIRFGYCELVVAGGVESMSGIPFLYQEGTRDKFVRLARSRSIFGKLAVFTSFRLGDFKPVIGIEQGLMDPVCGLNMGETAENLDREFAISREEQDEFALQSHQRACIAGAAGILSEEIVAVHAGANYEAVTEDVGPRKGQSLEALQKGLQVLGGEQFLLAEQARVGGGEPHVVAGQRAIEVDGGREALHGGVRVGAEAPAPGLARGGPAPDPV